MRTHTDVDEPHKKKRKAETHSLTTRLVAGMTSATTREPHGMMGHAHARRRNMKPSRPAESRWCGGADGRGPWITAACFIALEGSNKRRSNGFFLSSSKKKESTDSLMGGINGASGFSSTWYSCYITNRGVRAVEKPERGRLYEKRCCAMVLFPLWTRVANLWVAGHKTLGRLSHEKKHLRS